jgi:1,4-alpha-glucan branching enzyme
VSHESSPPPALRRPRPGADPLKGDAMSLKKAYAKDKASCKVSFELPDAAAEGADSVCLVGDFNNWNETSTPMKKNKDDVWTIVVNLQSGREYYFRYLINGVRWENDWNADKYVKSPYSDAENSVVIV